MGDSLRCANTAEDSDRHRCFKNSKPARACLGRREGPCQSGVSLRIIILLNISLKNIILMQVAYELYLTEL